MKYSCYNLIMDEDLIPQYAALLKEHYLFRGLSEAEIAHVVTRFEPVTYDENVVVIREGSRGEQFFIIFSGKVQVSRQERRKKRHLDVLGPGDNFGEDALLFRRPRPITATTLEPCIFLRLEREAFFELLQSFPQMRLNLSATAESRYLAQKEKFDWLGDDEVIYLITRRHEFFLLTSLILPIMLGVIAIPMLAFGITSNASQILTNMALYGGVIGIVLSVLWALWNWLDWGNDFYIVTNQRVLWLERIIGLYNSRREAPLTQVLAVNVTSSWLGRMLDFGNVDVRTFTGGILMHRAAHPKRFAHFVESFHLRAMQQQKQAEAEAMESALRERMGLPVEEDESPPETQEPPPLQRQKKPPKPGSLREKIDTFLKVRYEQGDIITYRKHWLLLLRRTYQPSLAFLLVISVASYFVWQSYNSQTPLLLGVYFFVIVGLILLGLSIWWLYNYLDWSNDIYQLTPDQIRDIERRPLGEELKKTAPLDSILSIEHARDGVIQLLFNFGNVIINVGQTQFIFRGVYNPDQVHQDVSDYIEARARKKREAEAARERERMIDWLTTYHHQAELLEEVESDEEKD